jgi:hypothetical protein
VRYSHELCKCWSSKDGMIRCLKVHNFELNEFGSVICLCSKRDW